MGQFINFVPHVGENCIHAMKNRQKNPDETTGNRYKIVILMGRTR